MTDWFLASEWRPGLLRSFAWWIFRAQPTVDSVSEDQFVSLVAGAVDVLIASHPSAREWVALTPLSRDAFRTARRVLESRDAAMEYMRAVNPREWAARKTQDVLGNRVREESFLNFE